MTPTLIYRASEHSFSTKAYHASVNGVGPTITLVKAQGNRIFGCYLHCKIDNTNDWIADPSGKSFIFSFDKQSLHRLRSEEGKLKAVFGGTAGPQIGFGCDFYIGEDCNKAPKSGSRLGGSY